MNIINCLKPILEEKIDFFNGIAALDACEFNSSNEEECRCNTLYDEI